MTIDIGIALMIAAILILCILTYRGNLRDRLRIDALQDNGWQVGYIDGAFAVLGGSPRRVIGESGPDLRHVIDRALQVAEAQADHRA
ncbi:hypothetical protein Acf1_00044 [Acidovorax phage ACF1]|nr:hypothetical protein Acf1_00044 [Acidovorax phage ACF1]